MEFRLIINGLISAAPGLVIWFIAVILSSVLKKRGGRSERLLIIGSSLMLIKSILNIFGPSVLNILTHSELSRVHVAGFNSGFNIFSGLIGLGGIVCLFYAVWKKFNGRERIESNN